MYRVLAIFAACVIALLVLKSQFRSSNSESNSREKNAPAQNESRRLHRTVSRAAATSETDLAYDEYSAQALADLMHDFPAAARWAEARVSEVQRMDAVRRVALGWGTKDSTAAFEWAEKMADPALRSIALENICAALMKTEPVRAMDLALNYSLADGEFEVVQLLRDWAVSDFSAAFEWMNTQPPGEQRDIFMAHLVLVQAKSSPVEAANLVAQQMSAGPLQEKIAVSVVHEWALHDLDGAIKWVELFPSGSARDKAIDVLETVAENRRLMSLTPAPSE